MTDNQIDPSAEFEELERLYKGDGNPLYAWDAYALARSLSISAPDWVVEYLDGCADRLLDMHGDRLEPGEGPGQIGKRLGFRSGLATSRGRFFDYNERQDYLARDVVSLMIENGWSIDHAARNVKGASRSAAWRAVKANVPSLRLFYGISLEEATGITAESDDEFLKLLGESCVRFGPLRPVEGMGPNVRMWGPGEEPSNPAK